MSVLWQLRWSDVIPLFLVSDSRVEQICLPKIVGRRAPLIFLTYSPEAALVAGAYGVMTPPENAAPIEPDTVVIPLLAFTTRGDRLGYGGGYYDRTLGKLRTNRRIRAIGYAYSAQEVDALPVSPLDQPLDFIVTERRVIRR